MLGPLIVSPRSGQDAFGWCRRVRRLPGLGRTHGGCGDYFEVEENGRIVARICYEPGVVNGAARFLPPGSLIAHSRTA